MDIDEKERSRLADLLIQISKTILLLNNNLNKKQIFSDNFISNPTIFAEISTISIQEQQNIAFPAISLYRENQNKIIIPSEIFIENEKGKQIINCTSKYGTQFKSTQFIPKKIFFWFLLITKF